MDAKRTPGFESIVRPGEDSKHRSEQKWTELLIAFYRRRRRGIEISLGEPFPANAPKPPKKPKNIARFALDVKAYLASNPGASHSDAAKQFKVSRARISQLLKIADNVPSTFIEKLSRSVDVILLKRFSGKALLRVAKRQTAK